MQFLYQQLLNHIAIAIRKEIQKRRILTAHWRPKVYIFQNKHIMCMVKIYIINYIIFEVKKMQEKINSRVF